jgi:flagellar basal body-associated protein FliL
MQGEFMIPIALFAMVVLLVWIGNKAKSARMQEQSELRKRLLDKFASGQELTEFLATPQGQNFLKEQEMGAVQRSPKGRIIYTIGAGVVLVMLGAAFFALMYQERELVIPGTIVTALGLGLLIASAISLYLYKKWNLLQ